MKDNKDKQEFFDECTHEEEAPVFGIDREIDTEKFRVSNSPEEIWDWIESKKKEWQEKAYDNGYMDCLKKTIEKVAGISDRSKP